MSNVLRYKTYAQRKWQTWYPITYYTAVSSEAPYVIGSNMLLSNLATSWARLFYSRHSMATWAEK